MASAKTADDFRCICCGEKKYGFYKSLNPSHDFIKVIPYCKKCVGDFYDNFLETYQDETEAIYRLCEKIDVFWDMGAFNGAKSHSKSTGWLLYQSYMKQINSFSKNNDYKHTFDESVRLESLNEISEHIKLEGKKFKVTEEICDRWGEGYQLEEYKGFEKKLNLFKGTYSQKTAMHTEALFNYIRNKVKSELATAAGNVKEAKDWGALATSAATAAKINPSQLSKADLSDGLSTFSELSQAVEKEVDIIPILPKFKYRVNDALDFNIWCYVNYMRDLSGLPLCEYQDIYAFYDKRKKDYIKQYGDPYNIFTDDTSEKNRENIKTFLKKDDA